MTPENKLVPPLLINIEEVAYMLGIAVRTARRRMTTGGLPKPIRLGTRMSRWRRQEIEDWIAVDCPPRHRWETMRKTKQA